MSKNREEFLLAESLLRQMNDATPRRHGKPSVYHMVHSRSNAIAGLVSLIGTIALGVGALAFAIFGR